MKRRMHKTLLLCFIHGFKGGDDTFLDFPEHLRALVSHALPNVTVRAVTYPKFDTRGDLRECVGGFREWLQNQVIDLEVAAATPSPTVEPSVHTILIGHSMGGIVAAETLLAITSDYPIPHSEATSPKPSVAAHTQNMPHAPSPTPESPTLMFPYIQGILAFDTPYLGISPGVFAHGAETHYRTASSAYSTLTETASLFGYGSASSNKQNSQNSQQDPQKLLTQGANSMTASMAASSSDAAATPTWQRWGKYAMFAGAAGAVAAGGAAAYLKRDTITEGWSWIGSHLEFVGCLAKGEELKARLDQIITLHRARDIGFADLVTVLGKSAAPRGQSGTPIAGTGGFVEIGAVDGPDRTFCSVPKSEKSARFFEKSKNDRAGDEMAAHMTMFDRGANTGYFALSERGKSLIVGWVEPGKWYRESEPVRGSSSSSGGGEGDLGSADVDLTDESTAGAWAGEEACGGWDMNERSGDTT